MRESQLDHIALDGSPSEGTDTLDWRSPSSYRCVPGPITTCARHLPDDCTCDAALRLKRLAAQIEIQRRVVDRRLRLPALWGGPLRRDVHGHARPGEHDRYVATYDMLASAVGAGPMVSLDLTTIRTLHDRAVG